MATISAAFNTPNFPFAATCLINTANPNRDGTGVTLLLQGAANGSIVNRVHVHALNATTPGMIRFFIKPFGAGYPIALVYELPVVAAEPNAVTPAWSDNYIPSPFGIGPSGQLLVSTEKGEAFLVTALGWHM